MQDTPQDTAAEAPAPDAEAAAVETPQEAAPQPNLEEQLRQAQAKAQEHHDGWLRAKAEVENIRKRAQDDVTKAHRYALDSFSEALLPVRDSLEASLAAPNLTID
ncbi:MAG: nucleotide exchange factor GrpE, partial [Betaproteobacteria bacterium]|nr:nucleotide exchange factor GrpE [Betaproteobacteria bacterium]